MLSVKKLNYLEDLKKKQLWGESAEFFNKKNFTTKKKEVYYRKTRYVDNDILLNGRNHIECVWIEV